MRRLHALLLAFCLVLSQQGALLHALRHDFPDARAPLDDNETHPAGVSCPVCLAFAHIAGVATSAIVPPTLLSMAFHWSATAPFVHRPADVPQARARDPPGLL